MGFECNGYVGSCVEGGVLVSTQSGKVWNLVVVTGWIQNGKRTWDVFFVVFFYVQILILLSKSLFHRSLRPENCPSAN